MELFDLYGQYIGPLLLSLSKIQINITAIQLIQVSAAIIGASVSVFGAYKAWRYAEKRLGHRLIEFLKSEEMKLHNARATARALTDQKSTRSLHRQKLHSNDELQKALGIIGGWRFGKKRYEAAEAALQQALEATASRSSVAQQMVSAHEKQRAVAHVLLGAIADAQGQHQKALLHFLSALEIDEQDVEALEYAGHQYLRLGNARQALEEFSKIDGIARATGNHLLLAYALRDCGLAYQAKPIESAYNANRAYREAIRVFPNDGPQLELAYIHELRGLANIKLGNGVQAYESLMQALARYAEHERIGGTTLGQTRTGSARVIAALKALEQSGDGTSDGDSDGAANANGTVPPQLPLDQQQLTQQPPDGERPN